MRYALLALLTLEFTFFAFALFSGMKLAIFSFAAVRIKFLFFLPFITVSILTQAEYFLSGVEESDSIEDFESDDIRITTIGNYDNLLDNYYAKMHESLIRHKKDEDKRVEKSISNKPSVLQQTEAKNIFDYDLAWQTLKNEKTQISRCYIDAMINILNGENTMIIDEINGEFLIYLTAVLKICLIKGEKFLVLCADESKVAEYITSIKYILKKSNGLNAVWKVGNASEFADVDEIDIFICTNKTISRSDLRMTRPEFFKSLKKVIIADIIDILSEDNISTALTFRRLGCNVKYTVFSNEKAKEFELAMEHIVGSNFTVYENEKCKSNIYTLFWRNESLLRPQNAFGFEIEHYVGTAHPIAIVALKYGVTDITVITSSDVPFLTYCEIINEHDKSISTNFLKTSSIEINKTIRQNNFHAKRDSQLVFGIIYDKYNNLINVYQVWQNYAGDKCTFFNIISDEYLLRDYFCANLEYFEANDSKAAAYAPYKTSFSKTNSVALLQELYEDGMSDDALLNKARAMGFIFNSCVELLTAMLEIVFSINASGNIYNYFSFVKKEVFITNDNSGTFKPGYFVRFTTHNLYSRLFDTLKTAEIIYNDSGDVKPISCLAKDIYNYFLPGQTHTFFSESYKIYRINEGSLMLDKFVGNINYFYEPYFECDIIVLSETNCSIVNENLQVCAKTVKATKRIKGYFAFDNGKKFDSELNLKPTIFRDCDEIKVEYDPVNALEINFKGSFADAKPRIIALLIAMLNEVFKTVLPKNYRDVFACANAEFTDDSLINDVERRIYNLYPLNPIIVSPDCSPDSVRIYIVEFISIEKGIVRAIEKNILGLLSIIREYLKWALNDTMRTQKTFINYGLEAIPSIFDPEGLLTLLDSVCRDLTAVTDEQKKDTSAKSLIQCDFCGKDIPTVGVELDDGRIMCSDCKNHTITRKKEISELYTEAKELLEEKYTITLPTDISVKFKSQKAIRKAMGGNTGTARVLGFFNFRNNELWVERGGPEVCTLSTLIHELVHNWQHANLNMGKLTLEQIEGHSSYVEVELMRENGSFVYADSIENSLMARDDEYGKGFKYYKAKLKDEPPFVIFKFVKTL
jgi:hypothetical protein